MNTTAQTLTVRRALVGVGLAGIALIHLLDLPGKFEDGPGYLAWAYVGLIVVSLVLLERVVVRGTRLDLGAAAGLAAAVFVGFVINRTVGMPGAMDDIGNWLEPLGVASLAVELLVVWQALMALVPVRRSAPAAASVDAIERVPASV